MLVNALFVVGLHSSVALRRDERKANYAIVSLVLNTSSTHPPDRQHLLIAIFHTQNLDLRAEPLLRRTDIYLILALKVRASLR